MSPVIFITDSQYWQNTHFNFPGTKQLLGFLTTLHPTTLSQLRHLAVKGSPLPLFLNPTPANDYDCYKTYGFEHVLPLFPGLQLSTLRVQDPWLHRGHKSIHYANDAVYHSIQTYICSQGFREMRYKVAHDGFLRPVTYIRANGEDLTNTWPVERHPQPSTWDRLIKRRDGVESGAGVEMFRLLDKGRRRVKLRTEFEIVQPELKGTMVGDIEIVIRRGRYADVVQRGEQIYEFGKGLSQLFQELTWKEILEKELYVDPGDDPWHCL